ncbi:MAG: hypothetical protein ACJAQT_005115 [Akkermansiaceae bacterium]|jgi:hypothetical protein
MKSKILLISASLLVLSALIFLFVANDTPFLDQASPNFGGERSNQAGSEPAKRVNRLPQEGSLLPSDPSLERYEAFLKTRDPESWELLSSSEKANIVQSFCVTGEPFWIGAFILDNTNPGRTREQLLSVVASHARMDSLPPSKFIELYSMAHFESEKSALVDGLTLSITSLTYGPQIDQILEIGAEIDGAEKIVEAFMSIAPYLKGSGIDATDPDQRVRKSFETVEMCLDAKLISKDQASSMLLRSVERVNNVDSLLNLLKEGDVDRLDSPEIVEVVVEKVAREKGVDFATDLLSGGERALLQLTFGELAQSDPTALADWFSKNESQLSVEESNSVLMEMGRVAVDNGENEVAEVWLSKIKDPKMRDEASRILGIETK